MILRRFGFPTTVLAEAGTDYRGEFLRESLAREGVPDLSASRLERPTGAVVEIIETGLRGGHRFVFSCPKCLTNLRGPNLATREQVQHYTTRLNRFDVLFFDRAASTLVELARRARDAGVLVVFEPNRLLPGSRAERAAVLSDVVKYSGETVRTRPGWLPPRDSSPRLVVETLGSSGLKYCLRSADDGWSRWKHMAAIAPANVTDTAGAGDWCTAGMIHQLVSVPVASRWTPSSVERALTFGQALAAVSVSFHGPRGVLAHSDITKIAQIARRAAAAGAVSKGSIQRIQIHDTPVIAVNGPGTCPLCLSPTAAKTTEHGRRLRQDAARLPRFRTERS